MGANANVKKGLKLETNMRNDNFKLDNGRDRIVLTELRVWTERGEWLKAEE